MPVYNMNETKVKRSFEIQLNKEQIKEMKGHIKSLKKLKKEIIAPIMISDNVVLDLWFDDNVYFHIIPTLKSEYINLYERMWINEIKKASKNSNTSTVEDLLIYMSIRYDDGSSQPLLEMEPFRSEIEKRQELLKNMCQIFNDLLVNAAGLSKKEGAIFLDILSGLTFTESNEFIEGILKGNRMIVE